MREIAAGIGPGFVNSAVVAVKEDAPRLPAAQNRFFVFKRRLWRILLDESARRNAQMLRQAIDIALSHIRLGNLAATGAGAAIDLLFNLLGNAAEFTLREIMRLQVLAEALVFALGLYPKALDLNKIGNHSL